MARRGRPFSLNLTLLAKLTLITIARGNNTVERCKTLADLVLPQCDYVDLPVTELKSICERVDHDIEEMFSWMLDTGDERSHEAYAEAASLCHDMMNDMLYPRVDHPDDIAKEMMTNNHELLDILLEDMIENEPDAVTKLEEKIRDKNPTYYDEMMETYTKDHSRAMILSEMIFELTAGDAKFFDSLGLDITSKRERKPKKTDRTDAETETVGDEIDFDTETVEDGHDGTDSPHDEL